VQGEYFETRHMWFVVPAHVSVILAAWLPGGRVASALTTAAAQFAVICLCDRMC